MADEEVGEAHPPCTLRRQDGTKVQPVEGDAGQFESPKAISLGLSAREVYVGVGVEVEAGKRQYDIVQFMSTFSLILNRLTVMVP